MNYNWKEALRLCFEEDKKWREQLGRDMPECPLDEPMWRAAANLTTKEYAYARFLKLKRQAGEKKG